LSDELHPITTEVSQAPELGASVNAPAPLPQFALREYFGVWQPSIQEEDAMNYILEEAKNSGLVSKGDILLMLSDIERKVGMNELPRLMRVFNWMKVNAQISDLLKQRKAFENA
jgi:hypothetical protein